MLWCEQLKANCSARLADHASQGRRRGGSTELAVVTHKLGRATFVRARLNINTINQFSEADLGKLKGLVVATMPSDWQAIAEALLNKAAQSGRSGRDLVVHLVVIDENAAAAAITKIININSLNPAQNKLSNLLVNVDPQYRKLYLATAIFYDLADEFGYAEPNGQISGADAV